MAAKLTPDAKAYVQGGGAACPYCGSPDIEATDRPDAEGREAYMPVQCTTCKREWQEVFLLAGVGTFKADGRLDDTFWAPQEAIAGMESNPAARVLVTFRDGGVVALEATAPVEVLFDVERGDDLADSEGPLRQVVSAGPPAQVVTTAEFDRIIRGDDAEPA